MAIDNVSVAEVARRLDLRGNPDSRIQWLVYRQAMARLEAELGKRRNNTFGSHWTGNHIMEDKCGDPVYMYVYGGQICAAKFDTLLILEGPFKACLAMKKEVLEWVDTLDLQDLLRAVRKKMPDLITDLTPKELDEWIEQNASAIARSQAKQKQAANKPA